MPSSGTQGAVRHNVLADMGIDVWVLRSAVAATAVEPVPVDETAPALNLAAAPDLAAAPELAKGPESATEVGPALVRSVELPAELTVVCLVSTQVLMLVDDSTPERRRLLVDIFAAANGVAGSQNSASSDSTDLQKELAFSWSGDEQAQWRALGAFVDKQIVDHGPKFILCSAGLCAHLPVSSAQLPVIQLASLAELGKRVDLKRELWQQIQNLRT